MTNFAFKIKTTAAKVIAFSFALASVGIVKADSAWFFYKPSAAKKLREAQK